MAGVPPTSAFRLLAVATAVSAWALVAVGGVVRISESGLGCPDWPLCEGRVVPSGAKEPVVEYVHRATAVIAIALLLVTTVWALRRYRGRPDIVVPLALAAALVPVQAVLGATVVWLELPAGLVGVHFMVGMTMLGLTAFAGAVVCRGSTAPSRGYARAALGLGAAALLVVSLGAGVVATDAMHACGPEWPACNGGLANGGQLALLQVAHRTGAYLVLALALVLGVLALRGRGPRVAGLACVCLAVAQAGFGVGIVLSHHGSLGHELLRSLHVAAAAAFWAFVAVVVAVSVARPVPPSAGASSHRSSLATVGRVSP